MQIINKTICILHRTEDAATFLNYRKQTSVKIGQNKRA